MYFFGEKKNKIKSSDLTHGRALALAMPRSCLIPRESENR